jgi:hypothetical protein
MFCSCEALYVAHPSYKIRPPAAFTSLSEQFVFAPGMMAICTTYRMTSQGIAFNNYTFQRLAAALVCSLYVVALAGSIEPRILST